MARRSQTWNTDQPATLAELIGPVIQCCPATAGPTGPSKISWSVGQRYPASLQTISVPTVSTGIIWLALLPGPKGEMGLFGSSRIKWVHQEIIYLRNCWCHRSSGAHRSKAYTSENIVEYTQITSREAISMASYQSSDKTLTNHKICFKTISFDRGSGEWLHVENVYFNMKWINFYILYKVIP